MKKGVKHSRFFAKLIVEGIKLTGEIGQRAQDGEEGAAWKVLAERKEKFQAEVRKLNEMTPEARQAEYQRLSREWGVEIQEDRDGSEPAEH